ncbi:MAG: nucleotidyltransferase [Oscillospiraceae bacterium]|nr:nucleotidyltransferase [Oscillospiraceae bacterium]
MREPVLVIMAAGMGSRFGSLKQITPVDDEGHKLIDFSLYDARRAGFGKVVFIIKKAIDADFRQAVGSRMEREFDVRYIYQELDRLPPGFSIPQGRAKPWGTAHAVACAAPAIDGPFAVLNADDYYGPNALKSIYQFLKQERGPGEHAMVGYLLRNTVTEHGAVSRGICRTEDGFLRDITERTRIEKRGADAAYTEDGAAWHDLPGETVVSMNLWGFQREILPQFTDRFSAFLRENLARDPLKCEYYLPAVANAQLKEGLGTVQVIPTGDVWHGVTYPEDLQDVRSAMARLKEQGVYPQRLWK